MKLLLPAALCLVGMLAGCEKSDISDLGRREMTSVQTLLKLQQSHGAVLVEIYGAPWEGADPAEIAGTLRMPKGPGRNIRFQPVTPGQGLVGDGARLVMLFNPTGKPDDARACGEGKGIAIGPPDGNGFVVHAIFCHGKDWIVKATLDASDVAKDDWLTYYLRMKKLLAAMFPNS